VANENGGSIVTVKNWHAVLLLVAWLVGCTLAFANLRSQGEENERRIRDLEMKPSVTLPQYQDGQLSLEKRLDRIEAKVDKLESRH
jgi:hypothetical protein